MRISTLQNSRLKRWCEISRQKNVGCFTLWRISRQEVKNTYLAKLKTSRRFKFNLQIIHLAYAKDLWPSLREELFAIDLVSCNF